MASKGSATIWGAAPKIQSSPGVEGGSPVEQRQRLQFFSTTEYTAIVCISGSTSRRRVLGVVVSLPPKLVSLQILSVVLRVPLSNLRQHWRIDRIPEMTAWPLVKPRKLIEHRCASPSTESRMACWSFGF